MTEGRCPSCEALLTELECFECALINAELTATARRKTHCRNGHEFTPANTRLERSRKQASGWQVCLQCRRDRVKGKAS